MLSTLSSAVEGYPSGSLVSFGTDAQGLPVFCFSSMSGHTKDLNAGNTQAALTVTAKGFEGAADGRVHADRRRQAVRRRRGRGSEELREIFKAKHPGAFWADFGDFTFYRMHALKAVNFVGGFARARRTRSRRRTWRRRSTRSRRSRRR